MLQTKGKHEGLQSFSIIRGFGREIRDRKNKKSRAKKRQKQDVPLASLHQHFIKICKANKDEGETGSQGKQKRGGE